MNKLENAKNKELISQKKDLVWLVYPPSVPPNGPGYHHIYPSLPVLAGSLRKECKNVNQLNLHSEFLDWLFRSDYYNDLISVAYENLSKLQRKNRLNQKEESFYENLKRLCQLDSHFKRNDFLSRELIQLIISIIETKSNPKTYSEIEEMLHCPDELGHLMLSFYNDFFCNQKHKKPLFVGISIPMGAQLIPAMRFVNWFRKNLWNDVPIFFGGPFITLLKNELQELIIKKSNLKGIVLYEGEEAIIEIYKQLKSKSPDWNQVPNLIYLNKRELTKSPSRPKFSLNDYHSPFYEKEMIKKWKINRLAILQSRKCYWGKCSYCEYQNLYQRHHCKKPEILVNEMKNLSALTGISHFTLTGDCLSPSYSTALSKEIIKQKIDVTWESYIRVDNNYDVSTFKLMTLAGCIKVQAGIESFDTKPLKRANKGYGGPEALDFLKRLTSSRLKFGINIILDLPGTSYESALKQYNSIKPILLKAKNLELLQVFRFVLLRSSMMGKEPKKYNLNICNNWDNIGSLGCLLNELPFHDSEGMNENQKKEMEHKYENITKRSSFSLRTPEKK